MGDWLKGALRDEVEMEERAEMVRLQHDFYLRSISERGQSPSAESIKRLAYLEAKYARVEANRGGDG